MNNEITQAKINHEFFLAIFQGDPEKLQDRVDNFDWPEDPVKTATLVDKILRESRSVNSPDVWRALIKKSPELRLDKHYWWDFASRSLARNYKSDVDKAMWKDLLTHELFLPEDFKKNNSFILRQSVYLGFGPHPSKVLSHYSGHEIVSAFFSSPYCIDKEQFAELDLALSADPVAQEKVWYLLGVSQKKKASQLMPHLAAFGQRLRINKTIGKSVKTAEIAASKTVSPRKL